MHASVRRSWLHSYGLSLHAPQLTSLRLVSHRNVHRRRTTVSIFPCGDILMFTSVFAAMAILSFLLLVVVGVGFVHRSRTRLAGYALVVMRMNWKVRVFLRILISAYKRI